MIPENSTLKYQKLQAKNSMQQGKNNFGSSIEFPMNSEEKQKIQFHFMSTWIHFSIDIIRIAIGSLIKHHKCTCSSLFDLH